MRDARLSRCVPVVAVVVALAVSGISVVSAHSGSPAAPVRGGLPGAANASLAAGAPVGLSTLGLGGWKVQSSENATDPGNLVSTPGYSTSSWLSVTPDDGGSPGTEVNAILQNVATAEAASPRQLVTPGCAIAPATVAVTGASIDTVSIAVTAATYSATTHLVTLTFASQPVIPKVGAMVTVAGMTPSAYNASNVQIISSTATTLTYGLATNPGTATAFGSVAINRATLTFAAQSGASAVGQPIVVAGVAPAGYNGTFTTLASTTTSVSYYIGANPAAGSGGTVALNLPTDISAANVFYSNNMDLCFTPVKAEFARPWWFRTDFTAALSSDQRAKLVINGVMGQADVWVNGTEVASQATVQGAFAAYTYDVTDLLVSGTNSLAIEMYANNASSMFTSDFNDWSPAAPDTSTGITFPIQLHVARALSIDNAHVVQDDNTAMTRSDLTVLADVTNTTSSPQTGTVSATITPPAGGPIVVSQSVTVAAGSTQNVSFAPADYPSLSIHNPAVWWPYQMGAQPLYGLAMDVSQSSVTSDSAPSQTFGIRTITTYLTSPTTIGQYSLQWGSRVYVVNGVPFEFRGGGWQPDEFMRYSAQDTANQVQIMRGMGLNGFRTEGKELPDDFYQQMDRAGIVIDSGFTCCNKWQPSSSGSGVTANEYYVIFQSSYTIGQRLRNHPSVLGYGYSDNPPTRGQEIWSNMGFNAADFQLPILAAAEYKNSGVLGADGEKEGPYDWVPPSYWYDNLHPSSGDSSITNNGGAWAFDSETSAGYTVPTTDSLNRFLSPADQAILWQYPGSHQYHTNTESATANCPPASSTLTLSASAATWASNAATVTFLPTVPTAPMVGSLVTVAGVTPAGYNGSFVITASSTTSVTFALAVNPGAFVSGGTVTIPAGWSTTCNASHSGYSFGTLANLNIAITRRYGNYSSQQQYVQQAQVANYENLRSEFEAYLDHWSDPTAPSTGLDYWMLNKSWPSFLWNLYNYDYDQAGAYYGAAKAQESLHVLFAYDNNTVAVNNLTGVAQTGLSVESKVYDLAGNILDSQSVSGITLATQAVQAGVLKFLGGLNSLIAMGLVLVYRAIRVINFAQAALGALGAALAILLVTGSHVRILSDYWVAVPVGIALAVVTGYVVDLFITWRFARSPRLVVTVVTIGIAQVLGVLAIEMPHLFNGNLSPLSTFKTPFSYSFRVAPLTLTGDYLIPVIVVPVALIALFWFFFRTDTGIAIRGAADSSDRAQLLGIPVRRLSRITWMVAAGLSGIGAILAEPINGPSLGTFSLAQSMLVPLAAFVLAGMESLPAAVVWSLVIGVLQAAVYYSYHTYVYSEVALFLLILAGLVLVPMVNRWLGRDRPGTDPAAASDDYVAVREVAPIPGVLRRQREIVAGRILVGVLAVGVAVALPFFASQSIVDDGIFGAVFATIAVSLVILTGWAGQISLGQVAIAGMGACMAGALMVHLHVPFLGALLLGGVAGAGLAVLIGLPALRLEGTALAVVTLAFAVVMSDYVLSSQYFPWLDPNQVGPQNIFNRISLDILNPNWLYELSLAVLLFGIVIAFNLRRSRAARAIMAVRDNPLASSAYGISPLKAKLLAFGTSGFIAGIAGAVYIVYRSGISFQGFSADASVNTFIMVVIGGLGSITGGVIGAIYFTLVSTSGNPTWQLLGTGAGVLVVLTLFPEGFGGILFRGRDWVVARVARSKGLTPSGGVLAPEVVAALRLPRRHRPLRWRVGVTGSGAPQPPRAWPATRRCGSARSRISR